MVNAEGKIGEQRLVKPPAGEMLRQLLQVDANQAGLDAGGDHFTRQRIGRPMPEREQRRDADQLKPLLAVGAHVLQEQIAEHDVGDAGAPWPHSSPPPSPRS